MPLAALALFAQPSIPSSPLSIWFDEPATAFTASCPVGNGRLGAMLFGGVDEERIVLNENTMWSGKPLDQNRQDAWKAREQIIELLKQGKNPEAESLLNETFTSDGPGSSHGNGKDGPFGCYQALGDLLVRFHGQSGEVKGYGREVVLDRATARVRYERSGVVYTRELIASHPAQVIAYRLTASKRGALEFDLTLSRQENAAFSRDANDEQRMEGRLGEGVRYVARVKVIPVRDGEAVPVGETGVGLRGGTEALVIVAAGTDYSEPIRGRHMGASYREVTRAQLDRAASQGWNRLQRDHVRDFSKRFGRVRVELGETNASWQAPTPDRRAKPDPSLFALYFQFGRYLLLSSSREGGLPANLQGLWAEELQTPWNGDYHLNINVQMNYWLAEPGNLAECHRPLAALIEALVEPGSRTARAYYTAQGWIAHVITNAWGFTAPGESAGWGSTNTSAGWLVQHLWARFAFSGEIDDLRDAYPVMRDAARCMASLLIEEPKRGWLVTAPSNSPENVFRLPDGRTAHTCIGPTMDQQIVRELFANTSAAARKLGVDTELANRLDELRARLAPHQIDPDGRLQEWLEPYEEPEPRHRHTSHLYGLHPSNQITLEGTPELAAAARKTLEARGDESTGWSMAWKACFWARLGDGDRALKLLNSLLRPTGERGFSQAGGSYENLFCAHPPFQIDGNLGGAAAIAEMLLQSHESRDGDVVVRLLPAVPRSWGAVKFSGLRARGGLEVSVERKEDGSGHAILRRVSGDDDDWVEVVAASRQRLQVRRGKAIRVELGSAQEGYIFGGTNVTTPAP